MVKDNKIQFVDGIAKRLKGAKTFGIADVGRITSSHMQKIRKALRGKAEVKVIKRSLLKKALERAGLSNMEEHIARTSVTITSDLDAFSLFREIKKQRSQASAKPGMIAPIDIIIKEGGTGLPPGPAIADLQNAGIPSKIQKGQIVVIKDHIAVKAGEKVSKIMANALAKLDLKPIEMGLDITAILDDKLIFRKDVLDVDIETIRNQFTSIGNQALALAYAINYPVKEVLEKRFSEISVQAKALALKIDWVSKDTVAEIVNKANTQAISLKEKIGGV